MSRQERLKRVQKELVHLRLDAIMITDGFNLQYLTGFSDVGGDGCLLISQSNYWMITDARYETAMTDDLPAGVQLLITRDYYGQVATLVEQEQMTVVGFEDTLPYAIWAQLDEQLTADFVGMHAIVDHLREVKDETEIMALRHAITLSSQGYDEVLPTIVAGMTEIEVANRLDEWMRAHGSTGPSFATIVASGPRAAQPHGAATNKKLQQGELVTVDFGFYFDGYTSDITRTFALGHVDETLKRIYDLTLTANQAVIAAIRPGVSGAELDAVGRDIIIAGGYGPQFNHGMGHGIGLNIHEEPQVYGPRMPYQLSANQVITVEPGIYVPDVGGVRIEDDVLVTENGAEVLTSSPKTLQVI